MSEMTSRKNDLSNQKWQILEVLPKDAPYRRKYVVTRPNQVYPQLNSFNQWVYLKKFFDLELLSILSRNKGCLQLNLSQNLLLHSLFIQKTHQNQVIALHRRVSNLLSLQYAWERTEDILRKLYWMLQIVSLSEQCEKSGLSGFIREQNIKISQHNDKVYITDLNFNVKNLTKSLTHILLSGIIQKLFLKENQKINMFNQIKVNWEKFSLAYQVQIKEYILKIELTKNKKQAKSYYLRITPSNSTTARNAEVFRIGDNGKLLNTFLQILQNHERLSINIKNNTCLLLTNQNEQMVCHFISERVSTQKMLALLKSLEFSEKEWFLESESLQKLQSQEFYFKQISEKDRLSFQQVETVSISEENEDKYPYNCVGMIQTRFKVQSGSTQQVCKKYGTGVLLNSKLVLTCAHNLCRVTQKRGDNTVWKVEKNEDISFLLGQKHQIQKWQICEEYSSNKTKGQDYGQYDYALLYLKQEIARNQYPEIAKNYDRNDQNIYLKGYAQRMIAIEHKRKMIQSESALQKGTIQSFENMFINHDSYTQKGYSGSPLFVQFSTQPQFFIIVGVHIQKLTRLKRAIYLQGKTIQNLIQMQNSLSETSKIFSNAIQYKEIFIPSEQRFQHFDQYNSIYHQIRFSQQQFTQFLAILFIRNQQSINNLLTTQSYSNMNTIFLLDFLLNLMSYNQQRSSFSFLDDGTFVILAYMLNHIYFFWEKAQVSTQIRQKLDIFKEEMRQVKSLIFEKKDSQRVRNETVRLLQKNLMFVDCFQANQNLKRIFKMVCLLSKEASRYLSKRNYSICLVELVIFAVMLYKIYNSMQKIFPPLQFFIDGAGMILKQILYDIWKHDKSMVKSIVLSMRIYLQMNAASEQQFMIGILREVGELTRNNFANVQHNQAFGCKYIYIQRYISENIERIIHQSKARKM